MSDTSGFSISLVDSCTRGSPTAIIRRADGREFFLHSRQDPLEEARFLVEAVPLRERSMHIVLGFGLGYHVKELLHRMTANSHLVVVEPDFACLSKHVRAEEGDCSGAWMRDPRLHFISPSDPAVVPIFLADRQVRLRLLSVEMTAHIPTTHTADSYYQMLLREIPQALPAHFNSHLNSLEGVLENDLINFWANLPHSWGAPSVKSLLGKWTGRPLIIVSPGPSLTGALPVLRESAGKTLVLATGPAARVLLSERIHPDLVITVDPYEANVEHFRGGGVCDVPLVYYHRVNRGIPRLHPGDKFYFVMRDEPPLPLAGSPEGPEFWRGGSVAFSALQLAHHLGANPIIFVGQDFSFAGGHTHAAGCIGDHIYDTAALPPGMILIPGVDGKPVVTTRLYRSYLLYMQDYLRGIGRQRPEVRHINTSRTGAMIQGTECLALDEALAPLPPMPAGLAGEHIRAACIQYRRDSNEARRRAGCKWIEEIRRILAHSDPHEDPARMFRRLKTTSFYAQAAKSYDDVYYLFEVKYRREREPASLVFQTRFKQHLRAVLEELRANSDIIRRLP